MASASSLHGHLLSCSLCCEDYNDDDRKPKYLTCFHTFCRVCLHKWADKTTGRVECPNCRKPTEVNAKGVDGLQTNSSIAEMRDAFEKLTCEVREDGCSTHAGQPMFFRCVTCDKSICHNCTVMDHKESDGHVVQNIADSNVKLLAEVEAKQMLVRQQLESIGQDIDLKINTIKGNNKKRIKSKKEDFRIRTEALMQEERECVERMTHECNKEVSKLNDRKKEFINEIDALTSTSQCRKAVGYSAFASEVKNIKQALSTAVLEISKLYPLNKHEVRLNRAVACQDSLVTVTLYSGTVKLILISDIAVKITHHEDDELKSKMTASTDGIFEVRFVPKASGEHKAQLMVEGRMHGSAFEFMVKANNPIRKFEHDILSSLSHHMVVDTHGNYYLVDQNDYMINKFDSIGTLIEQFKCHQPYNNSSVESIALNEVDNAILYIPRGSSASGGFNRGIIRRIDLENNSDTLFIQYKMQDAVALTVNSQQHVIVLDSPSCLLLFDKHGRFIRKIGDHSMFKGPAFLTTDAADNIYVSDAGQHCILKFSLTGKLLLRIGKKGSGKGELDFPQGIATNSKYIAVADHGNRRIQLFHMDGGYAGIIGSEDDVFKVACDVVITECGDIAVLDHDHIKVYRCDMSMADLHNTPSYVTIKLMTHCFMYALIVVFMYFLFIYQCNL